MMKFKFELGLLYYLPVFFLVLIASSCGNKKNVTASKNETVQEKPIWIDSRPVSPSYYIGIGASSKVNQPLDYASIAQKNALADLASGISVKVQGQTFLNALEVNKNFSEEFISTISTTTNELVENYEIAGQWENSQEFWVYYRISKAEYQRQKQEKKNQALSASYDYFLKGKDAEMAQNLPQAIDLYFHGLFELKEYWNDVNDFQTDSGKVYLDNEIYSSIQRIATGLQIVPQSRKVVLSSDNQYTQNLSSDIRYNGANVRNIPVQYQYDTGKYMKPKVLVSDHEGKINVLVNNVNAESKENAVDLKIRLEELLPADLDKSITLPLLQNMKSDRQLIAIEMVTPSFFVKSEEKIFGNHSASPVLAQTFKESLVKKSMQLSSDQGESNYTVFITSNTTTGGSSQGFHVALLEMNIEVKNNRSGEIVFQKSENNIKGLQLNSDAAGIEAYKKGQEMLEKEIVKSMLEAIL